MFRTIMLYGSIIYATYLAAKFMAVKLKHHIAETKLAGPPDEEFMDKYKDLLD